MNSMWLGRGSGKAWADLRSTFKLGIAGVAHHSCKNQCETSKQLIALRVPMASDSLTLREEFYKDGYSREEEYFYRINQELIERRRRELDSQRAARQAEPNKTAHWMKCPKCG